MPDPHRDFTARHLESPGLTVMELRYQRLGELWAAGILTSECPGRGISSRDMESDWFCEGLKGSGTAGELELVLWEYVRGADWKDVAAALGSYTDRTGRRCPVRLARKAVTHCRKLAGIPRRRRTVPPRGDARTSQEARRAADVAAGLLEGFPPDDGEDAYYYESKGHLIRRPYTDGGEAFSEERHETYADTGEPYVSGEYRPCRHCGGRTPEDGTDPCLGWIEDPDVEFVCCGHGWGVAASVVFRDRSWLLGSDALAWFAARGLGPDAAPR